MEEGKTLSSEAVIDEVTERFGSGITTSTLTEIRRQLGIIPPPQVQKMVAAKHTAKKAKAPAEATPQTPAHKKLARSLAHRLLAPRGNGTITIIREQGKTRLIVRKQIM